MNSARNKAAETMEITDLVIEVVDARCPMASSNPMVEEMRLFRQRPCLKILNKADLADSKVTQQWLDALNAQKNTRAIAMNTKIRARSDKSCRPVASLRRIAMM